MYIWNIAENDRYLAHTFGELLIDRIGFISQHPASGRQ